MSLQEIASGLLVKLESKAEDLIDDKGTEWLDKLLDEGKDLAEGELEGVSKDAAIAALAVLARNKTPFLRLGKVGFAWVVGHYGSGAVGDAELKYLATQATFLEVRKAMHEAGDAAVQERQEREASWEALLAVLKEVGAVGLQFVVKLALKSFAL